MPSFRLVRWAPAGALVALLSGPSLAKADDTATLPLRIEYAAPAACPSEELFVAQVRERVSSVRVAGSGESASAVTVKVEVVLADSDEPYAAKLVLLDVDGTRSERVVNGVSCADVVRALAFIVSVYAVERAPRPPDPPTEVKVAPPPPPAPSTPPPSQRDPDRVAVIVPTRTAHALLASVGARNGMASRFGPEVGIAYERFEEGTTFAPALRVRVALAPITLESGSDRLVGRLFTAAVDGCGFRVGNERHTFGVSPCVRLEGGVATGDNGNTIGAAPWFAPGALAHLRMVLADHLLLEADAGVQVPLIQNRFSAYTPPTANDTAVLARTPSVATTFALSAGWAFR
jgi:hypothetical protein